MAVLTVFGELACTCRIYSIMMYKPNRLTSEEFSDLFDEVSQVIVGALHFVLGGGGFV